MMLFLSSLYSLPKKIISSSPLASLVNFCKYLKYLILPLPTIINLCFFLISGGIEQNIFIKVSIFFFWI